MMTAHQQMQSFYDDPAPGAVEHAPAAPGRDVSPRKAATAFRTISEVSEELNVQQHVLRFWETKFSQVRPLKRGGGRRYYRPEDVELIKAIHHLLYTQGYTIKGVQKLFREQGKKAIRAAAPHVSNDPVQAEDSQDQALKTSAFPARALSAAHRTALQALLAELKALRDMIA